MKHINTARRVRLSKVLRRNAEDVEGVSSDGIGRVWDAFSPSD